MGHKIRWYFIATLMWISGMQCKPQPIVLESVLIKMMDGASFGVSGYEIKLMLHILLKIQHMLDGEPDTTGTIRGLYTYDGKKCSIKQLAALEIENEFHWNEFKKNNPQENTVHENLYMHKKKTFASCLETIKKDFDHKVSPFLANARGSKQQLLILIKESCEKHGHPHSHLLKWGESEDGHETDAMYTDIHTFKDFEHFCQDLSNFMKDLIHSCPKAVAQYKELKAHYAAGHPSSPHHRS